MQPVKSVKTGPAIACEYVAAGANAKHTLVNVYTGDILVPEFPARIPMAFYVEIIPDKDFPRDLRLQILQNKKVSADLAAQFDYEEGKVALVTLPQMAVSLTKETEIRLVVSGEGLRPTTLVKKKISVGTIPD